MFLALESHITANLEASAKVRGRWTKDMLNIISLTWDTNHCKSLEKPCGNVEDHVKSSIVGANHV